MELTKKYYVRNQLIFNAAERETLTAAYNIVENVRSENLLSSGSADDYITKKCDAILNGISELLDNYTNEYPEK